jgi:Flp pilus assembly protein TadG
LRNVVTIARELRREERGVAAVEFALIVPFLVALYFGSIEAAALFTVDKRLSSISSTVGDLVAQWDPSDGAITTGTTGTLADYMNASTGIMTPYPTTGLKIVISLVKVKNDGNTVVLWSKANAAGTVKTAGQPYADLATNKAPQMNSVSRGGCVIASEVTYTYLPLIGQVFTTNVNMKHVTFFLPRFGSSEPLDLDTVNLADNACTSQT